MAFEVKGRTALVTGASAGIGRDIARELAKRGCNLIIVARRENRLKALADELKDVRVTPIAMDLTTSDAAQELAAKVADSDLSILINNVGRGMTGAFQQADMATVNQMIQLNITFTTALTHALLPKLLARSDGARIMNLGSVAGYQGVPNFAAYAATKSYINMFSESLNWELRGTNVRVTCLKPSATASEFFEVADMEGCFMSRFNVSRSEDVARVGVKTMIKGKPEVVVGLINKIMVFSLRLSPRELVRLLVGRMFADLK